MFNVGRFLRQQYDGFLGHDIREVRVLSSPIERCEESSRLIVSAAYPANQTKFRSVSRRSDEVSLEEIE